MSPEFQQLLHSISEFRKIGLKRDKVKFVYLHAAVVFIVSLRPSQIGVV